jgi:hypothetical protein
MRVRTSLQARRNFADIFEEVAVTDLDDARVSTVWFNGVYETQILGGPRDGERRRSATRDEALVTHAALVGELQGHIT